MITRIARGILSPNSEARVFEILRNVAAAAPMTPGMVSFSVSRKVHGRTVELIAVTIWADVQAMVDVLGADLDAPRWPPALAERIAESSIEVLETVVASSGALANLDAERTPLLR